MLVGLWFTRLKYRLCLLKINSCKGVDGLKVLKLIAPVIAPAAVFRQKKRLTISCKPLLYMAPRPGLEPGTN